MSKEKIIDTDNPIHRMFVGDILEFYGYPYGTEHCLNKQDKIMHIYGLMAVIQGLRRDKSKQKTITREEQDKEKNKD